MVRARSGFTLTELLVATAVFIIGFTAAFSMFLSAIRYRTFADSTARNAMAAASQMGEIYLDSGTEPGTGPVDPAKYSGNGDATNTLETGQTGMNTLLYTFNGIPGGMGRVRGSCAVGDYGNALEQSFDNNNGPAGAYADGAYATAIQVDILAMVSGDRHDVTTDYADLNQRLRLFLPNDPTLGSASAADSCDEVLVDRGIASVFRAVIVRHPHWYFAKSP